MSATIKSAITEGSATLNTAGVDESRNEANLLLMHVLDRDRTFLLTHGEESLSLKQFDRYRSLVARRGEGYPLQYLTGHQEFFKLDFEVTPDVLIPRPETELIVEVGLEMLGDGLAPRFADIATGSGCIAISLLKELPQASAVATDLSSAALAVAKRNAERHAVNNRLLLVESDLFCALDSSDQFDVIFSNPPYVPTRELTLLQREVRHEPQAALDGGPDGLSVIRRLLKEAPDFLRAHGHVVLEIGFNQHEEV
ncbi:MAG TPA: peptide chain release factor N(5)-glutamine methyltransferase, partial [Pyrinomonadaceae bacterium]|nr:peptide chain release factor N(5)-glutamine methyltransferase [Pyrinomonadaceae bacterium]